MISDAEVDQLLAPVSEDAVAGVNLEYDPSFTELERAAAGKEERYSGGELIPAEEPDWRPVREAAIALFARTKDLRVAMQLARAETALSGIAGLQAGMAVIRGILERYWEEVHPQLDAEEAFDPVFRINALGSLDDAAGLLGLVRKTALVEARSVGRYTFRDLDVAEERASAADGATAPTLHLLKAALKETGNDDIVARVGLLQKVREDLRAVESIFKDRAAEAQSPDIQNLDSTLAYGIAFLESGIVRDQPAAEAGVDAPSQAAAGVAGTSIGALRNRDDVKRVLQQVCEFLERSEPSNPAPLLIRRATRLLDRSFIDIIQDLAPEAFDQIEKLAGSEASASQE